MKKLIPLLIMLLSSTVFAGDDSEVFQALLKREWDFRLGEFPSLARQEGRQDSVALITHVSEEDQLRRYEYWKQVKLELDAISCEKLEREECINYRMFGRQIHQFLADYETRAYLIPFNSDWGFYLAWNRWGEETDFNSTEDYSNYLERLKALPGVMDEYIALMRVGLRTGMTQPRVILAGRELPIQKQLVENPERSAFYKPFLGLDESDSDAQQALLAEARKVVMEGVVPAYQRLLDFFVDEYFTGARITLGASSLPGGERFYEEQIYRYATLDMTAEDIHQLGLSEVARIRAEMELIIRELKFDGDFAAFIQFLRTDPQFYAKTPHELLAEASYFAKKVDGRLPQLFGRLPRQPYGVAPVPDNIAPFYTGGRYVGAPLSAHRGGYYWVNTYALESRTLYTLPALTLHEAVPGHHLQIALAMEQGEQPDFRRNDYISAYGEGWALYAEKLGLEMDIYETPYQDFGRLTYEMWRACRLVIDTGIHAKGWSRQQALDYLAGNTALSLHEVTTEVDRYISWPAQALSYKLGEYTIWQLRREAESRLGAGFDLRDFHDFILSLGSVPLEILKDEVGRWTRQQAGA
ncbi:MAG: DUF885 domain-containing protein [Gammaproteobacteria bacterium]|nr:DUF885 domain-containing protein [Gammaproteobacteria bacterium]